MLQAYEGWQLNNRTDVAVQELAHNYSIQFCVKELGFQITFPLVNTTLLVNNPSCLQQHPQAKHYKNVKIYLYIFITITLRMALLQSRSMWLVL